MKQLILAFVILLPVIGIAQDFQNYEVPFFRQTKKLSFPATGGLKNPMFSNIDLNNDGNQDLLVFDREGDVILPFIHSGQAQSLDYSYAPEYIGIFPKLRNFALLIDFNQDSIPDIFTGGAIPSTVEVYKGYKNQGALSYKLVRFDFNGSLGNFLQIYQSGYSQVYVSNIDLPAISDIDGDGDLDILAFPPSSDKLTYYENLAVEENLGKDTFKFHIKTTCWGGFKEDDLASDIYLSPNMNDCANFHDPDKGETRHSGSTTLALDIDGDGDKDILLGDLSNEYLKLLINNGTPQKAWVTEVDHFFPSSGISAKMQVFLGAYHVDVNNDGKRDLVVSPNDTNDGEKKNHIWLYLNQGSEQVPQFNLHTTTFLVEESVSLGSGSHPCFLDYNGDGLMDLLIGSNGILLPDGTRKTWMELYLNTGTREAPAYTLTDEDFLEFYSFANPVLRLAPSVGDLDGDGDDDLLVGEFFGRLFFYENIAGAFKPMEFESRIYPFKNLFIGNNSKPAIFDANNDGLMDLVIGEVNNELNYIQNIGSEGFPEFGTSAATLPNTKNYGQVFKEQNNYFLESGAPYFIRDENGPLLALGSQGGQIRLFEVVTGNPYTAFPLVNESLGNVHVGNRSIPAFANIDGDPYMEMCVGNERGGINFYKTNLKIKPVSVNDEGPGQTIDLIPNPAKEDVFIRGIVPDEVRIFSYTGQLMLTLNDSEIFNVEHMKNGIYIVHIFQNQQQHFRKLIVTGH